jgi:hypothetical protein
MRYHAAITVVMQILLDREGVIVVVIASMILTLPHHPKLLQETLIIFLTGLGKKPFVLYASKYSCALSSSSFNPSQKSVDVCRCQPIDQQTSTGVGFLPFNQWWSTVSRC